MGHWIACSNGTSHIQDTGSYGAAIELDIGAWVCAEPLLSQLWSLGCFFTGGKSCWCVLWHKLLGYTLINTTLVLYFESCGFSTAVMGAVEVFGKGCQCPPKRSPLGGCIGTCCMPDTDSAHICFYLSSLDISVMSISPVILSLWLFSFSPLHCYMFLIGLLGPPRTGFVHG